MADKKLYLIETISMFRMRYIVEDENPEWANDTYIMNAGKDDFRELSQYHADEVMISTREVSQEEMIRIFDEDNPNFVDWSLDRKLKFINRE